MARKVLEVELNFRWFKNYFDILKDMYHTGYFVIVHQRIRAWKDTAAECIEWALAHRLQFGRFSVQGFKDIEEPMRFCSRVQFEEDSNGEEDKD